MNTSKNSEPKLSLESRCGGKEIGIRQVPSTFSFEIL